jgi:uncharacterized protein (TIGR02145 family)
LKSIAPSTGTLLPTFAAATTAYTVNVVNSVSSISVTGTATNSEARVAGNVVDTSLVVGSNTITLTVTAPDGKTTKVYTVTVVRAGSSDANLSGITLSTGALSPTFAAATLAYRVSVDNSVSSISVTGIVNQIGATVKGNVTDTSLVQVIGSRTTITLVVTAENGTTTKTYTVTVICYGTVIDDQGNTYRTLVYNGVEWMVDNSQKTSGLTPTCDKTPIDQTTQALNYGYLYSWNCVSPNQACPAGWSLPTNDDFDALVVALNAGSAADKAAAWAEWNTGSSLAGYGNDGSYYSDQGLYGYWFSSSSSNRLWYVRSGSTSGAVSTDYSYHSFSVRCRKNP